MCSMLLLLHDAPGAGLCDAAAAAGFSISTHRGFRFSHHEGGDALASLGLNWGGWATAHLHVQAAHLHIQASLT